MNEENGGNNEPFRAQDTPEPPQEMHPDRQKSNDKRNPNATSGDATNDKTPSDKDERLKEKPKLLDSEADIDDETTI